MKDFSFHLPVNIIFGSGKLDQLDKCLSSNYKNILIVTDQIIYSKTSIIKTVKDYLGDRNVFVFNETEENPSFETIEKANLIARQINADVIIGIGGGSCLDAAKGVAIATVNEHQLYKIVYEGKKDINALPLICIPTTSGTGSEVSPFAVFTDYSKQSKIGYANDLIFPKFAIIDPELTYSMPKNVIRNTGLDALSHAIEAFLSDLSFDLNNQISINAITIIIEEIQNAINKDSEAMQQMSYAAMLAGISITHASTILPHIMGYPLTTFHNLPHGLASILMLPPYLDYLRKEKIKPNKIKLIDSLFMKKGGLKKFLQTLGVNTKLSSYGVNENEIDNYVEKVINKGDVQISPGKIDSEVIRSIYKNTL